MWGRCLFSLALGLGLISLVNGCGGSSPAQIPAGTSKVSLTIHDTPPAGVTVLSFEISVTGVTLNPQQAIGSASNPVSILNEPVSVELTQLVTESTFLNSTDVTEGRYDSVQLTFANPRMTIQNNSGADIGSCANGTTCELTPSLRIASANYPLALGLSANTSTGLQVDFDLSQSVQSDLSIVPTIKVSQLPLQQGPQGQLSLDEINDLVGQVTQEESINQRLGLINNSGQMLTIYVGNTEYFGFTELGFLNGQTVRLQAVLHPDGTLWATKSYLQQDPTQAQTQGLLVGMISSVDNATQFHMVVHNLLGATNGAQIGDVLTVNIQGGATYVVEADGLTVPSGFSFASPSDLLAGQEVQIAAGSGSSSMDVSTNQITLLTSQLIAGVSATNPTGFSLSNLPALFTGPGYTTLSVAVQPETQLENVIALSVNQTVGVRGLLFNTVSATGAPSMVASKVSGRLSQQ